MPEILSLEEIVSGKAVNDTHVNDTESTGSDNPAPAECIDKQTSVAEGKSAEATKKKRIRKPKPPPKPENLIPRGQPKSGRFWKTQKTKASTLIHTRGLKRASTFEKKEKLRADLKHAKELTQSRLAERKRLKEEHKERRRENLKRQEENRKRSEIVQVIRNPAKIKRMRKKQLRNIEKRDTTNM